MNSLIVALLLLGLLLALLFGLLSALQRIKIDSRFDAVRKREQGPTFRDYSAGHTAE